MKPQLVEIYDTTLRDGSQGRGINFSVADKLRIAERLDEFGVHYIEGGWPGSNPKDIEFFRQARSKKFKNAKLAAFGSTRRKNMSVEKDEQVRLLINAGTPVVTIYGKTSLLHVKHILGTTPEENLAMIGGTIRFLKSHGKFVIYDAEHAFDGYHENPQYALTTWKLAREAGADRIVLCDTNGATMPSDISGCVIHATLWLGDCVGVHTHNDRGMAVANAFIAVECGATHVQGTVNGYGERVGNCDIVTLIPNLHFAPGGGHSTVSSESLPRLCALSRFVNEVANLPHDSGQPWVGESAFSHKGGTHVNAVRKFAKSYEHADPALVGNTRTILVSDLAGRSNIILKARELGLKVRSNTPALGLILSEIKRLEHEGYEFEAAEGSLALLISNCLKKTLPKFSILSYHVSTRGGEKDSVCEASVKALVGDKIGHQVAEGDGPINALDSSLRLALREFYPKLEAVRLIDYKVRILGGGGTAAKTRVLIQSTDGKREWGTVGVHENIVEASLEALTSSMLYALSIA